MILNVNNEDVELFDNLTKQMTEYFNDGNMQKYNVANNLRSAIATQAFEDEVERINKANKRS